MPVTPKKDPILAAIANIEKTMGNKGASVIRKFGDYDANEKVQGVISYGFAQMDAASNLGGCPRGRLIEIFGQESGGKSLISLRLIASAQKQGIPCCLVDAENSFDPKWAAKQGVDVDNLYIIDEAMSAEKTLDYVVGLCMSKAFGLVVIDSTAALIPQVELEGSIGKSDYALLARAMSKGCRKIAQACGATNCTCVFLNQIRDKMGVTFGDPTTTPGGRALKFYASQRVRVNPGGSINVTEGEKKTPIGLKSYVKFVKNKVAPPFGECELQIIFVETALHPVVKLCNESKNYKLIGTRDGLFQIKKDVIGAKKNLDTGVSKMVELADYIVKNNLVDQLLEAYIEAATEEKADKDILAMRDDPSLITSPLDSSGEVKAIEDSEASVISELDSEDVEAEDEDNPEE